MPDHSTISQLRRRKPRFRKVFRRLFEEVVRQCIEKGLVSGWLVATDSTHVKANASRSSDSGYDSALVQHELGLADIAFYTVARETPDNTKLEFGTDAFSYDEGDDVYRCPNGKVLTLRTLYRSSNGLYWVYWAELSDCRQCTMRGSCLCDSHQEQGRRILRNYFEAAVQSGRKCRNSPEYLQALRLRQIWCEGSLPHKTFSQFNSCPTKRVRGSGRPLPPFPVALNLKRMIKYAN